MHTTRKRRRGRSRTSSSPPRRTETPRRTPLCPNYSKVPYKNANRAPRVAPGSPSSSPSTEVGTSNRCSHKAASCARWPSTRRFEPRRFTRLPDTRNTEIRPDADASAWNATTFATRRCHAAPGRSRCSSWTRPGPWRSTAWPRRRARCSDCCRSHIRNETVWRWCQCAATPRRCSSRRAGPSRWPRRGSRRCRAAGVRRWRTG